MDMRWVVLFVLFFTCVSCARLGKSSSIKTRDAGDETTVAIDLPGFESNEVNRANKGGSRGLKIPNWIYVPALALMMALIMLFIYKKQSG